jgi:hypothetical protein
MRPETEAALNGIFNQALTKEDMGDHLTLITTMVILALRQIRGDEFMLGFLQAASDDVTNGVEYDVKPLNGSRRAH